MNAPLTYLESKIWLRRISRMRYEGYSINPHQTPASVKATAVIASVEAQYNRRM